MTSTAPVPTRLAEVPDAVEAVLRDFLDTAVSTSAAISPVVGSSAQVVADFVLSGGKRIRPVFAFAGWQAGNGDPARVPTGSTDSDALRICAALELVQACALIHDDIIDASDTRRGRPTVHRVFERGHGDSGWRGDAADHGIASAILAGDFALAWADDLVHGYAPATLSPAGRPIAGADVTPLPPGVIATWAAMRTEVLGGQVLDIVNEVSGEESAEAAYRVMEFKTAAYTVARPLELGARVAGASEELIDQLRSVGHDLGIAFQLQDDLLGVFGDPERTGKPSGDDLAAGKRTALLALGLARADERDPALGDALRSVLGTELSPDELTSARGILTDVGAVADIERTIDTLLDSAITTLENTDIDDAVYTDLVDVARRMAHRNA